MSDLESRFAAASRDVQQLPARPSNDELLELYAFYKQATDGDVQGSRPGMMNFVARAKYDAWAKLAGTPKPAAMESYVALVERLQGASRTTS